MSDNPITSAIPVPPNDETQQAFFTIGETDANRLGEGGPFLPPPESEQNQEEFYWLMAQLNRPSSILEIGSREGGFLKKITPYIAPGARICSIDIGLRHPEWQNGRDTIPHLQSAIGWLREQGFDAQAIIQDSQNQQAVEWAKTRGPFDFVFVDGDHDYLVVREDWDNYSPLTKIIGFHDIVLPGPKRLWDSLTKRGLDMAQIISPNNGTGIGIVRMSKAVGNGV